MKSFRHFVIILCLLMYCEIYAQGKAEKGLMRYGETWNSMNDADRTFFLARQRHGMKEGYTECLRLYFVLKEKDHVTYNEGFEGKFGFFADKRLCLNLPEIDVLRDVMTKFYADPGNKYLSFQSVFLISVAKIRGASPWLIEEMLATARKDSYEREYSVALRILFCKEVMKVK